MEKKLHFLSILLLSGLACLIQVQVLIGKSDTYMGIRINLGDFLLPIIGLYIVISLLLKKSSWPKWRAPYNDVFFFSLTGVIIIGLVNTYIKHGEIGTWAILNRGVGWGILSGYLLLAGWCITNLSHQIFTIFLRVFIGTALGTIIIGTCYFLLTQYGIKQSGNLDYKALSGFLGNRNAFAFFMLCTVIIYTTLDQNKIFLFSQAQEAIMHLTWICLPIAMIFNGSRAGWVGCGLVIVWFFFRECRHFLRYILPALLISSILICTMYFNNPASVFRENQQQKVVFIQKDHLRAKTDSLRITVANDALELWNNNKVLGSGIGGFLTYQEGKYGKVLDQIDNSALWVLTELGIVGAIAFGTFYIIVLITLCKNYKSQNNIYGAFSQSMVIILILFALFSLVHQILYARYLWLLLGFALALPLKENQSKL